MEENNTRPVELIPNILRYCLMGGLCPLVPMPWLDDWAMDYFQIRMLRKAAQINGIQLNEEHAKILAEGYEEKTGCFLSAILFPFKMIFFLVVKPAKQLMKKVTIVLAIKQSADMISLFLHQGILTEYCIRKGILKASPAESESQQSKDSYKEQLLRTARAVNNTCKLIDYRPFNQIIRRFLKSSLLLVSALATGFLIWVREARKALKKGQDVDRFDADEEKLRELTANLQSELMISEDYIRQIHLKFDEVYAGILQEEAAL